MGYPSQSTIFAQHIEQSGSFSQVCKNMLEWIKKEDLTREQIISIQASESSNHDADAVLTVFYRRHKDPLQQTSLRDLQYHLINNLNAWMVQYLEVQEIIARGPIDIISLTHTARNIGQVNIQILWFLPGNDQSPKTYTVKHFYSLKRDDAVKQAITYLDSFVAPHRLVNVSTFEEDHPNKSVFNVVTVARGDDPAEAQDKRDDSIGKIYDFRVILEEQNGWLAAAERSLADTESRGRRCTFATFNQTQNENEQEVNHFAVGVLTWSKEHEDALIEASRGFCNCSIF